jgi:hypothetical protein
MKCRAFHPIVQPSRQHGCAIACIPPLWLLSGIDDGQWTIGSIPLYRVVIALTSGHGGGGPQVALWRPND